MNNKRRAIDVAAQRAANPPKRQRKLSAIDKRAQQVGALGSSTRPEFKNLDVTVQKNSALLGIWSPATALATITQGNTSNQRVGRRVVLKSLLVRYSTPYGTSTANNTGIQGRILIVYDRSPLVTPDITDVLNVDNINGLMDLGAEDRYIILADQYLNNYDTNFCSYGKIYKKFNLEQLYATGGTTLGNGQIWLFYNANQNSTSFPLSFNTRVRFIDL